MAVPVMAAMAAAQAISSLDDSTIGFDVCF